LSPLTSEKENSTESFQCANKLAGSAASPVGAQGFTLTGRA